MLNIYRRHIKKCPNDTRDARKCSCPIWMDWVFSGRRISKPLGIRDWQAAQIRAREMEASGLDTAGEPITIRKATEDFEKDALNTMKASTLKQYKLLFRQLNKFAGEKGLVFLRQMGVVETREFRNSWTIGPRTAGKHLERLKRFFNFCIENQWLTLNPAKPLKSPKVGDTDVIPFTEEEIKKILIACKNYEGPNRERLKVLTNLMLSSGLRIGDAVTICKDRVVKTADGYSVVLRTAKTELKSRVLFRTLWLNHFWRYRTIVRSGLRKALSRSVLQTGGRYLVGSLRRLASMATHTSSGMCLPSDCS